MLFLNRNLILLVICQGLFLTNNVSFIAINGLVGLSLAPSPWMATFPVMGYVVGSAASTSLVAIAQNLWGRKASFQIGLIVGLIACLICAWAVRERDFWLLLMGTMIAGFYSANAQLYRFAAAELTTVDFKEKAVSWVLAGGIIGGVLGPNIANWTKNLLDAPYMAVYISLAVVAFISLITMRGINFPEINPASKTEVTSPKVLSIYSQLTFLVSVICAALGYGVMSLLMSATPLAMNSCGFEFHDTAFVLEWHVIGMFAPGFLTGGLIKRFGALKIMMIGVALNLICVLIALSGQNLSQFVIALFTLGVGWNFIFTGSTTMAISILTPAEKNKAQASINFWVFSAQALSSLSSGMLITSAGWNLLNLGSLVLIGTIALSLIWLYKQS